MIAWSHCDSDCYSINGDNDGDQSVWQQWWIRFWFCFLIGTCAFVSHVHRLPLPLPRCCHQLERAAVNCVISSGPSVPCMQRTETWWGGSVNTALQGAHMSTFWNISLTLRLSKKWGTDSQHSAHNGNGPVASLSNAIRARQNPTIKWKGWVYFSGACHFWKDTNGSLFKG